MWKSDCCDKCYLKSHSKTEKCAKTCISHSQWSCKHIRGSKKTGNYTVITLDKQVEELKPEIDNLKEDKDRKEYIFVKMYEFQHISPT